ncbi:MAG TPA: hypothetical protein VF613_21360, partial [Longimicrobium sp.]
VQELRRNGSWCGETHVQKGTYLLQELKQVTLEYDFILYKHGPYSFTLTDELGVMRGYGLLTLEPSSEGFRPRFAETESALRNIERHKQLFETHRREIEAVARIVGKKSAAELERLTTALLITIRHLPTATAEARAARLHELKSHVSLEDALEAVRAIDAILSDSAAPPQDRPTDSMGALRGAPA